MSLRPTHRGMHESKSKRKGAFNNHEMEKTHIVHTEIAH